MADNDSPLPEPIITALDRLAQILPAHGANYALIGGIAIGIRGRMRATDDIDLLLTVPAIRLPGLLEGLVEQGFSCDVLPTIQEWTAHHFAVLNFQNVRIDLMKPNLPAYQHVLDRAVLESRTGGELRVATAEGLILLKLFADRTQDLADIESLLVANRGKLDLPWIEQEWCTLFELDDPRWQRYESTIAKYYER